jgi:hypothetical protein
MIKQNRRYWGRMQHHNQVEQAPNQQVINPKSYATYLTYMYIERVQIGNSFLLLVIIATLDKGINNLARHCAVIPGIHLLPIPSKHR